VSFNSLGMRAYDCTPNHENHAGGMTVERYAFLKAVYPVGVTTNRSVLCKELVTDEINKYGYISTTLFIVGHASSVRYLAFCCESSCNYSVQM